MLEDKEVKLFDSSDSLEDDLEIRSYGINQQDEERRENFISDNIKVRMQTPRENNNYRIDDTINDLRKVNLSFDKNETDGSFINRRVPLSNLFGEELISYYKKYFTNFLNGTKYVCNSEICKLEYLTN
mmetsp:Transcript_17019/g.14955  ORF Transcript_17019/g.14955 Transcript_17019/m.14955 type:complete len:128 (+) Transcript_17019:222-605(+)